MSTLADLYDYVLPDVPGVITEVADVAIRNALIEFVERSMIWRFSQTTPLLTVATQAAYALTDLPAGARIVQIEDAQLNGKSLDLGLPYDLRDRYIKSNWETETGPSLRFTSDEIGQLILSPIPDTSGGVLTAKATITYTPAVATFEDWIFNRYYKALAHGAKAELFAMLNKPWSSPNLHVKHLRDFESEIGKAGAEKDKGYTRAVLRSRPVFK